MNNQLFDPYQRTILDGWTDLLEGKVKIDVNICDLCGSVVAVREYRFPKARACAEDDDFRMVALCGVHACDLLGDILGGTAMHHLDGWMDKRTNGPGIAKSIARIQQGDQP